MKKYWQVLLGLFFIGISVASAQERTPIIFWHSMAGEWGNEVNYLAQQFNRSQPDYKVIPVYKGDYPETLTSTVAAFRAHQQPAIVQIFEVATATMVSPKGVIIPFHRLMADANLPVDNEDFLPAVHSYYADTKGQLLALPFNSSSAVLYYNKDAFVRAGLDPNKPPTTWPQVKTYAQRLLKAGSQCGFTSAWPSWIQLETLSAWHNQPLASLDNGFAGLNVRFLINNPLVLHHLTTLAKWQKRHIFQYGGRSNNASSLFTSGQCAMYMQSSGSLTSLKHLVPFSLGVGAMPYWPHVAGAPQNTIIGGAALWTLTGHSQKVYQGVAKFYQFILTPEIQAHWQEHTGYVPVTRSAHRLSQQRGYYRKYPGAQVAIKTLNLHPPTANSKGSRIGNYPQIREVFDQELEAIWSGIKTPKQALADAVQRANHLVQRFARNIA